VRAYDWSITGDPNVRVRDTVKDWCAYLGYTVTPFEGPQKQQWERYEQIPGKTPLVGEYTFDQYYRNFKNHILPEIGTIAVGRVTREDIKAILDMSLTSKKYNSDTVVHFRKSAHLIFEWQRIECKSIRENPVHDITIKKQKLIRERRSGEPEEFQRIFDLMRYSHLLYACRIVYSTGLRPEEVCGMKEEYDYSAGMYAVEEVVTRSGTIKDEGKSENAERGITLSDFALSDIQAQREMKKLLGINSLWLFPNRYGSALNSKVMSDTWRDFARKAGSDLTLYELRHTATTIMSDELSDRDLKGTLGHSKSMDTHGTYDHQLKHHHEEIRAKMNKAYAHFEDSVPRSKIIQIKKIN